MMGDGITLVVDTSLTRRNITTHRHRVNTNTSIVGADCTPPFVCVERSARRSWVETRLPDTICLSVRRLIRSNWFPLYNDNFVCFLFRMTLRRLNRFFEFRMEEKCLEVDTRWLCSLTTATENAREFMVGRNATYIYNIYIYIIYI